MVDGIDMNERGEKVPEKGLFFTCGTYGVR
jgi:hypothetical protein